LFSELYTINQSFNSGNKAHKTNKH